MAMLRKCCLNIHRKCHQMLITSIFIQNKLESNGWSAFSHGFSDDFTNFPMIFRWFHQISGPSPPCCRPRDAAYIPVDCARHSSPVRAPEITGAWMGNLHRSMQMISKNCACDMFGTENGHISINYYKLVPFFHFFSWRTFWWIIRFSGTPIFRQSYLGESGLDE